ncbi:hypothetical protein CARUB_v10006322mg, partial [Capsella rubella]
RSTGVTRLVRTPSSYYPFVLLYKIWTGSEMYGLSQGNGPSSKLWLHSKDHECFLRELPNMTTARVKACARFLNGKIYNWGEVFDIKTQTWEPLPDPGAKLRFPSISRIGAFQGKLYVRSNAKKDSVYDPKEGGKLLLLWEQLVHNAPCQEKGIWCAMIALERRDDIDEVWGNVEWANIVLIKGS